MIAANGQRAVVVIIEPKFLKVLSLQPSQASIRVVNILNRSKNVRTLFSLIVLCLATCIGYCSEEYRLEEAGLLIFLLYSSGQEGYEYNFDQLDDMRAESLDIKADLSSEDISYLFGAKCSKYPYGEKDIVQVYMQTDFTTTPLLPSSSAQPNYGSNEQNSIQTSAPNPGSDTSMSSPSPQSSLEASELRNRAGSGCSGCSGGGGDPEDPEPDSGNSNTQQEDDPDRRFKELEEKLHRSCLTGLKNLNNWYKLGQQGKLIRDLASFAAEHPKWAAEAYRLIMRTSAIRFTKTLTCMGTIFGLAMSVGEAAYHNNGIAIGRSLMSVFRVVTSTVLPVILKDFGDLVSSGVLLSGVIVNAFGDNGFAHAENSTHAIPWESQEFTTYLSKVMTTAWLNSQILQIIDKGYPYLACPSSLAQRNNLNIGLYLLLAGDVFVIIPVASWLAAGSQLAGYPGIGLTTTRNPYGPAGQYPLPYCDPKIAWLVWGDCCRATANMPQLAESPE